VTKLRHASVFIFRIEVDECIVKVSTSRTDSFVKSPPPGLRVVLVYGPDEGLVLERSKKLGASVVQDLSDPFLVCELTGAQVAADPARLADEVSAISMIGGRRLIRVRDAGDNIANIVASVIEDTPGDALTVLQAGQLSPRSALRKLAEKSDAAAAIACYADDASSLDGVIRETLAENDVGITSEAAGWLVGQLGADRGVSRSEIEKLALYAGVGAKVDLEAAMASVGNSAAESMDALIYAAGDGDSNSVDLFLMRLFQAGASSVGILRALTNHLMKLESAGVRIAQGEDVARVLKTIRPPVFYKLERRFQGQLKIWRGNTLSRGLQLTLEAELQCKRTGIPGELICGRVMLQIASLSRQQRRAQ
jgi:DNA polymerase-3 subunit delta